MSCDDVWREFLLSFNLSREGRIEFFALRQVLQAPCGSQWEVYVFIHGQKSLTALEFPHTDMLL